MFDTGTLDGFLGSSQSLVASLSLFFSFSVVQVLVGLRKQFMSNFVFITYACAADCYNNYNIRQFVKHYQALNQNKICSFLGQRHK